MTHKPYDNLMDRHINVSSFLYNNKKTDIALLRKYKNVFVGVGGGCERAIFPRARPKEMFKIDLDGFDSVWNCKQLRQFGLTYPNRNRIR